jgi:hypothetical protein
MNSREKPLAELVEACIARVLQSERDAQVSIESARGHATASLTAARERARAIAERAERRLLAARQSVEARIARRQGEVDARVRQLHEDATPAEAQSGRLDQALAAVAASLTAGKGP